MLATQCSFCQHENVPGSRFCMKCGSPMHLKVCPNPKCGKVSDVTAEVCESCGQAFPKIALAPARAEATVASKDQDTAPTVVAPPKSRIPAWPLVMMAIVAGGLPLLWANRAQLPTPKTWQLEPDAPKTKGIPPAAVTTAQKPPAAAADVAPPVMPAPIPAAAPSGSDPGKASNAGATESPDSPKPASAKPAKKTSKKERKKAEPPRPCTEAVAALGLCDPKQAER